MTAPGVGTAIVAATLAAAVAHGQVAAPPERRQVQQIRALTQGTPIEVEEGLSLIKRLGLTPQTPVVEPLLEDRLARIQREVEQRLKPVPFVNGQLSPVLAQGANDYYTALDARGQALLEQRARSVGRLEIRVGDRHTIEGTAFVVRDSLLATNCHVLTAFATLTRGAWAVTGDVRVDFGDGPVHNESAEFRVTGVETLPQVRGLDIAVLRVSARSIDGTRQLPPALPLHAAQLSPALAGTPLPIGIVGYPSLQGSVQGNFRLLRGLSRDRFAKLYSPGAVDGVRTFDEVEMLQHVAGTSQGSSGSPVFALDTMSVVGVHNCCTAAGPPPEIIAAMPCSAVLLAPASRNEAISSFEIAGEPSLRDRFTFAP